MRGGTPRRIAGSFFLHLSDRNESARAVLAAIEIDRRNMERYQKAKMPSAAEKRNLASAALHRLCVQLRVASQYVLLSEANKKSPPGE